LSKVFQDWFAYESRADIGTSFAVFIGAGATYLGASHVELVVTAGLSLLILWLGIKHGRHAVYALLDASLDADLEQRAVAIAEQVPGVLKVEQLRLRRAGPFRFGMAHIQVRGSIDVVRGHEVAHNVVDAVRAAIPSIEMLTVHAEPFRPEVQHVVVPAEGDSEGAPVSEHFGRAPFFACATVSSAAVTEVDFVANTAHRQPVRAGLAAIKKLLRDREVDAVLTREIGEIVFHTLRDHYVVIHRAPNATVRDAVAAFANQSLPLMRDPTHASEAAGAPDEPETE